ncbi:glycoside hydrolase family 3 protein [Marinicauda algicola]|uniref:Glycoside hydrolase family 3 protein n=1 Tax=Marinicauda algicola TaxID=2029849 RepID=A0A4S2GWN2_9PROT|nr:glycoside hydrolase family 3 protein [Marinicauda algicola]TGY87278.1 glycoside hydrolase family 3 protein [Marinicauda algicola]
MKRYLASVLAGLAIALSNCAPNPEGGSASIEPSVWPQTSAPFQADAALEERVADLLSRMTIEEKVGQVIQADIGSVTPEEVREFHLGSILNGGNSAPGGDNYAPPQAWLALADAFHEASTDTRGGRLAIPVIWGTDAVHGHNNVLGATIFPHNIGLGAANDPDLIRRIGEVTALEVRVTGQDWTFAPTLAVVRDDRWGRTYESYSENSELVARYAPAMIEGLQGVHGSPEFLGEAHVLATAKHFIGDGGTERGVDQGDNRDSEAELASIHGAGYPPAIEAGALSIMASFNSWRGEKVHGHRGLLTDILVGRLGFEGFVVGDWNGHGQVQGCTPVSCAQAFNAGIDLFMAPDSWRDLHANMLSQVRSGEISMERLDEAVARILRVKIRAGLLDAPRPSQRAYAGEFERLGSPAHREVARAAVRQSLVLLKNEGGVLPLSGASRVLVAGEAADNIGQQTGGWTLNWQGEGNDNSVFPNGQSLLGGFREALEQFGGEAVFSPDGSYQTRPDAAIVVFGEMPYAEFQGDVSHLDFDSGPALDIMRRLRADGIPVVAVFLSGRPMWVNPELNAADAFVAAWLPGTEGGGVADVLIGDEAGQPRHDFTGRLSFSWPARPDQTPLNVGDPDYAPLFAYGFGGDYRTPPPHLGVLDESAAVSEDAGAGVDLVGSGRAAAGFALILEGPEGERVAATGPRASLLGGRLQAIAADRFAQEDTRRFVWNGSGSVRLEPEDGAPALAHPADRALELVYAVDAAPDGPVSLSLLCEAGCTPGIDISQGVDIAAGKGWRTARMDLSCFADSPEGLDSFEGGFAIESAAGLTLTLADARIVVPDIAAGCEF